MKIAFATNEGQTSRVTETPDGTIFALRTDKGFRNPDREALQQAAKSGRISRERLDASVRRRRPPLLW